MKMYAAILSLVFLVSAAYVNVTKKQQAIAEATKCAAKDAFSTRFEQAMPIDEVELRALVAEKLKTTDFDLKIGQKVVPRPTGGPGPGSQVTVSVTVDVPWYTDLSCESTIGLE